MVKPRIGVSMLHCLAQPFDRMTQQIPKNEIRYVEIVDDGLHTLNKRRVSALKEIGESYNLKYTVHAPFAGINIAMPSKPLLVATLKRLKQSIVNASTLDCQLWIFHPAMKTGISMFYPGMDWAKNVENANLLLDFAADHGVHIAIENVMEPFVMKNVEEFGRFYSESSRDIGLVLDTGHANLYGQLSSFLAELPEKIVHIHAHDNDGKSDQHRGIGYGTIKWEDFAALVRKVSFDGVIIVESVEHVKESVDRLRRLFG